MHITKIDWLDKEIKEAVVKVTNKKGSLICFSCPCSNSIGDVLTEPLECLDADDIVCSDEKKDIIEKMDGMFQYRLQGQLRDSKRGIIDVCGFVIHIASPKIPNDIRDGMYVQIITSRIDIW